MFSFACKCPVIFIAVVFLRALFLGFVFYIDPHLSLGVRDVYPCVAAICPKTWHHWYLSLLQLQIRQSQVRVILPKSDFRQKAFVDIWYSKAVQGASVNYSIFAFIAVCMRHLFAAVVTVLGHVLICGKYFPAVIIGTYFNFPRIGIVLGGAFRILFSMYSQATFSISAFPTGRAFYPRPFISCVVFCAMCL